MRPRFYGRPLAGLYPLSLVLAGALLFILTFATSSGRRSIRDSGGHAKLLRVELAKSDPHALVQAAIDNELKNSYGHRPPARYLLRKKTRNTDTTKEIVETSQGGVARLVAIHNQPLNATQTQTELQRLQELASDPASTTTPPSQ